MHIKYLLVLTLAAIATLTTPEIRADALPSACPSSASLSAYLSMAGGCMIGDKIFSNFSYSITSTQGGATAIVADGITVNPITTSNDPGLQFSANWSASSGQVSDSLIGFTVTVADQSALIEDASVTQLGGSVIGTGTANVGEGICLGFNCQSINFTLNTINTTDATLIKLGDHESFSPVGQVRATDSIGVSGNANGSAGVSLFAMQFSEIQQASVPEPAMLTLLSLGLLGCSGAFGRRRRFS